MARLTEEGVKRLLQVKEHILRDSKGFDMDDWLVVSQEKRENGCGTTACLAGWVCYLNKPEAIEAYNTYSQRYRDNFEAVNKLRDVVISQAASLLLTAKTPWENGLFYKGYWPEELREEYKQAEIYKDYLKMAQAAGKAIDWYIGINGPVDPEYRAEVEDAAI